MTVLILGGTAEARALAGRLDEAGRPCVSSLAGRVDRPRLPVGRVRIGGFGGAAGLAAFLRAERIGSVVDATHPFAAGISANAAQACSATGVPLLRLQRPGWSDDPGADRWTWVDGHDEAARAAQGDAGTVFLTTGRQSIGRFIGPLAGHRVLVRVVEAVGAEMPGAWSVVLSRGPYDADSERNLMRSYDVSTLITKDSGGALTRAKLDVSAESGVHVIVVRRPTVPEGVDCVDSVQAAARWAGA